MSLKPEQEHGHTGGAGDGRRILYDNIAGRPMHYAGFATNTGSQSCASSGSPTGVTLQTVDANDIDVAYANGFRAKEKGFWNVSAAIRCATNGTAGQRDLLVLVNGSAAMGCRAQVPAAGNSVTLAVSACLRLAVGDIVTLAFQQASGAAVSVESGSGCTFLSISRA